MIEFVKEGKILQFPDKGKLYQVDTKRWEPSSPLPKFIDIRATVTTKRVSKGDLGNRDVYYHRVVAKVRPRTAIFMFVDSGRMEDKTERYHRVICGEVIGLISADIPLKLLDSEKETG